MWPYIVTCIFGFCILIMPYLTTLLYLCTHLQHSIKYIQIQSHISVHDMNFMGRHAIHIQIPFKDSKARNQHVLTKEEDLKKPLSMLK